ncbi:MAG: hypothetical protein JWO50_409 [Candidatus Kaiserbacteria bacterium]|nr:hypothetical protein [Candidatus Kaiserbacteria bacterium]
MNYSTYISTIIVAALLPVIVLAQVTTESQQIATSDAAATSAPPPTVSNDGILSCNQTAAYGQSVGAFSARSSVYVPVSDAAVTLNTGYLVYVACQLRPLVDRLREKAIADTTNQTSRSYLTGRDGTPMFSQNYQQEGVTVQNTTAVKSLQTAQSTMAPAFSSAVTRSLAQSWIAQTDNPYADLRCPNPVTATTPLFDALGTFTSNPACYPLGAYEIAQEHLQEDTNNAYNNMMTQLSWGQGTYPQTEVGADGITRTVTPASVVNAIAQQALTSGFRQTESANDIGQMVSALFTGMGNQILQNSGGLSALGSNSGGQPSYFDQVSKNATQGVISTVTNIALQTLSTARQVEAAYYNVLAGIADLLTQAIGQVRGTENACWTGIIAAACSGAPNYTAAGATCTTSGGTTLHIATTTTASQAVIAAQIQPYATAVTTGLSKSQSALTNIDRLIASVANTSSNTAQAQAIAQFNQLVAQNAFHNQTDIDALTPTKQGIVNQLAVFLGTPGNPGTLQQTWGDGAPNPANPNDPNSGWCNVNNPATITMWQNAWK